MKIIYCSEHEIKVDDEDFEELSKFKWSIIKNKIGKFYAIRNFGKKGYELMHRRLTNASKGDIVDHKNRNSLDNRKLNLRLCTRSQNGANSSSRLKSTSQYLGVSKMSNGKWRADIQKDKKTKYIGSYEFEEDAAIAYDNAAILAHGAFANLNLTLVL